MKAYISWVGSNETLPEKIRRQGNRASGERLGVMFSHVAKEMMTMEEAEEWCRTLNPNAMTVCGAEDHVCHFTVEEVARGKFTVVCDSHPPLRSGPTH